MMIRSYKQSSIAVLLAGILLAWAHLAPPASADDPPAFLTKWGTFGGGDSEFSFPPGIAVDSNDNVYVADAGNNRIQKFDGNGNFLTEWGSSGSSDGQFDLPIGVAVDSADNVYVVEAGLSLNHRVQKFDSSGTFLTKWGANGTADGQFRSPTGIAVDSLDNVYVVDHLNDRVQKFSNTGSFVTKWGTSGSGDGQFVRPVGVAVDSLNNIYVTDSLNFRVQKFDSSGSFLIKWGALGSNNGEFSSPAGIAVDSADNVYAADRSASLLIIENHRVQKFSSTGTFLTKWGTEGVDSGQFADPADVAIDSQDNIFVVEESNHRVQKFGFAPLVLTKTVDDDLPDPGQLITYTITVDNKTITTATDVAVSDTLPSGLTFAGPILLEGTTGITDQPPNIASGLTVSGNSRITVTLPVTVNTGQDSFTVINNTAAVTSSDVVTPQSGSKSILLIDVSQPVFLTLDGDTGSPLITPTLGITVSISPSFFELYPAFDNGTTLTYTLTLTGTSLTLQLQTTADSTATAKITFSPPISLPSGVYSWTVQAEDAAGNLSDLIESQTFSIQAGDGKIYLPAILKN